MFLLDTDVLSASRRPEKAAPELADWVMRTNPLQMHLSAVSVLEVRIGALRMSRRDEREGAMLQRWVTESVLAKFEGRIIALDSAIALRCAELHGAADADGRIAGAADDDRREGEPFERHRREARD